jgi:hypothetical protein
MKLFIAVLSIIILSAILGGILPWWIIAPVAFLICYLFKLKWYNGFLAGFVALFILWAGVAFFIDHSNEHILSNKISILFFKSVKPFALIAMTGLIGGLVAGFAGMTGAFLVKE